MFKSIKTFRQAACVVGVLAGPVQAVPISEDPLHLFATCAGQMEAELNFASAWHLDAPQGVAATLRHFRDLVDAMAEPHMAEEAAQIATRSRVSHIVLLWRATFGLEVEDVAHAERRAARERMFCRGLLLS